MLRFPNPGSNIDVFVHIFQALAKHLDGHPFSLDDMSRVMVDNNLVSSCGHIGKKALSLSTRSDRSRDPIFNQSKMYAELFRTLGWFHPSPDSSLIYFVSPLGRHVHQAAHSYQAIVRESLLGIVYPNAVLGVKGEHVVRPFAAFLRTAAALGGQICRDELILGPMCLSDDRDQAAFDTMVSRLKAIRGSATRLQKAIAALSQERGIAFPTMTNYTRFPIGSLEWSGWMTKVRTSDLHQQRTVALQLTEYGMHTLRDINMAQDVRARDFGGLTDDLKQLCELAFYRQLERTGFNVAPLQQRLKELVSAIEKSSVGSKVNLNKPLLFSPFQEWPFYQITSALPKSLSIATARLSTSAKLSLAPPPARNRSLTTVLTMLRRAQLPMPQTALRKQLEASIAQSNSRIEVARAHVMNQWRHLDKRDFYPHIAGLFSMLGTDCTATRPGINYQRWDAVIKDSAHSVPIEIKSPTEEECISVKAVRQALENKVVFLARRPYPNTPSDTSLAVGYALPRDRSDVLGLIEDIWSTYKIRIGLIDLSTLLTLALNRILRGQGPDFSSLHTLHGIPVLKDA